MYKHEKYYIIIYIVNIDFIVRVFIIYPTNEKVAQYHNILYYVLVLYKHRQFYRCIVKTHAVLP